MTTVWLWQADGPASGGRGISGDRLAARRAAEGRLLSGAAAVAWVDQAVTNIETSLADGYYRVARWQARLGPGRRVWWAPVGGAGEGRLGRPESLKWPAVALAVRRLIADGTLKPGDRASIADLGSGLRVGRKTAARALAALEAGGFLGRQAGVGYVVLERAGPEPG